MKKLFMVLFIVSLSGTMSLVSAAWEGQIFEVFRWGDAPRCPTWWGGSLPAADGWNVLGSALEDAFDDHNWSYMRNQNKGVDYNDFISNSTSWPYGADTGDVLYYLGHGSWRANGSSGGDGFSFTMGESHTSNHSDCQFWSDAAGLELGSDTNVFISGACNHGRYNVWANEGAGEGFNGVRKGHLAVWNAWHGAGQATGGWNNKYPNYVSNSWSSGVGKNWVDMSIIQSSETNANNYGDFCTVSVTWGGVDTAHEYDVGGNHAVNNAAWRFMNGGIGTYSPVPSYNYTHGVYWFIGGCCPWDGADNSPYCSSGDQLPGTHGVRFWKNTKNSN